MFDISLYLLVVTISSQFIFILPPVVLHFHVSFQIAFFPKASFQLFPSLYAFLLQCFSSLTDYSAFLAFSFLVDFCTRMNDGFIFVKILYAYLGTVRDFFFVVVENFLTDDFRC